MKMTRGADGIHIHLRHQHIVFFISSLLLALVVLAVFLTQYYFTHYYDSSTSKSELKDLTPQPPPPEIKNKLAELLRQKANIASTGAKTEVKKIQPIVARIPILMYHYVEYVQDKNDKTRISLNTTPYTLEEQLKTLISAGYTFLTMHDLTEIIDGKAKLPAKPIALTFDDGYRDFYTYAFPLLKQYNVKATQYVISGFTNYRNHLTTDEITEIAQSGLVEIGAHTVHHLWLKNQSLKTVADEIFRSRLVLQQLIGKPVTSFAYPFGAFDDQTVSVVKDAGFTSAVSTLPGNQQGDINRLYMFRLRGGGRIGQALLDWLATDYKT